MLPQKYQDFLKLMVYQIYPRSFNDSNSDGIGDLNGIIEKLDHIPQLGVYAVWICPCYKSPNDDNGYDIADYRDIMDEFGTLEDMKRLIAEMHRRGLKVIMDLVPNHTSTQHRWFQESRKSKNNPYSDYYYWFDQPQNDWQSCFGGTAWAYDEMRGQYYLHSYAVSQADLNWNNPAVVKEMQDVVDFWVDLGVDGFRCDVIDQIDKDWIGDRNCFGPRLHEFIHALFGREKTKHLFTVGECWCEDLEEVKLHCHAAREELTTLFQFEHMEMGRTEKFTPKPGKLAEVRNILTRWQTLCRDHELIYSLFTDNHDQPQFISRVAHEPAQRYDLATCVATMFYTLRGIPFIYQGQEMGMISPHYDSIGDFDDIESKNKFEELCLSMSPAEALERINFGSRDNTRHPMCWDGTEYGGFSDVRPWIAPHSMVSELNLERDLAAERSVCRFYQQLLKLRSIWDALTLGDVRFLSGEEDNFLVTLREYGDERILVVCNFEQGQTIRAGLEGQLLLTNLGPDGPCDGYYEPFQTAIYRL